MQPCTCRRRQTTAGEGETNLMVSVYSASSHRDATVFPLCSDPDARIFPIKPGSQMWMRGEALELKGGAAGISAQMFKVLECCVNRMEAESVWQVAFSCKGHAQQQIFHC